MEIPRNDHQVQAPDNDEEYQSEGIEDGDNCRSERERIQEPPQEILFSSDCYHQQFEVSSAFSSEVLLPQDLDEKSLDSHLIKWCDLVSSGALKSSTASSNKKLNFQGLVQEGFNVVPKLKAKRIKSQVTEIHGSRVVQPTGRKDRHSKVCTARGTRDRRVRLSPKTAIQFYDVQDRLGYDRPSKAIDWLMKEAKAAIDALDDEPPPPLVIDNNYSINVSNIRQHQKGKIQQMQQESCRILRRESEMIQKHERHLNDENSISSFSFFAKGSGPSSSTEFQTYSGDDFNSSNIRSQPPEDSILSATYPSQILNTNIEIGRFQRFFNWNYSNANSGNAGRETESFMSSLPPHFSAPPVLGHNHMLSQREPLQSSINNYSPISTRFPEIRLTSDEFSYLTTAATVKEDDKETNPVSSNPSSADFFLHEED